MSELPAFVQTKYFKQESTASGHTIAFPAADVHLYALGGSGLYLSIEKPLLIRL